MKTAVSIPDEEFDRAERFAQRRKMTRSALFTAALAEYLHQHRDEEVTRRLNELYAAGPATLDPVLQRLQSLSLPRAAREDW